MKTTSEEKETKRIKSFIYLDEYKMYSISSQIFEGLTRYITHYSSRSDQELEQQEGEIGSGRILADIITQGEGHSERKFLHDYSYTLFEKKLFEEEKVTIIDSSSINNISIANLDDDFVKISGRVLFNDLVSINELLSDFNKLGEAITYVSSFNNPELLAIKQGNDSIEKNNGSKGFSKKNNSVKENLIRIAKELGLNYDQDFLDKLSILLNYGYRNQFEIQISLSDRNRDKSIFSASLERKYLKENENLLINKYSRYTEKELVLFGIVTQSRGDAPKIDIQNQTLAEPSSLKTTLVNLTLGISGIEDHFSGKLSNQVVIDPIAVYREI